MIKKILLACMLCTVTAQAISDETREMACAGGCFTGSLALASIAPCFILLDMVICHHYENLPELGKSWAERWDMARTTMALLAIPAGLGVLSSYLFNVAANGK